jgi:hypothetical protein
MQLTQVQKDEITKANDSLQAAWLTICAVCPFGNDEVSSDCRAAMALIDRAQDKLLDARYGRTATASL